MHVREIWELGLTLEEALAELTDEGLRERHNAALKELQEADAQYLEMTSLDDPRRGELLNRRVQLHNREGDLCWALWSNLQESLSRAEHIALGFSAPRHVGDSPVIVPFDFWDCIIGPGASAEHSCNGLTFVAVRVIPPDLAPALTSTDAANTAASPPGRPSLAQLIKAAIVDLRREDASLDSKPWKERLAVVRGRILQRNPHLTASSAGLADRTLRRHYAKALAP